MKMIADIVYNTHTKIDELKDTNFIYTYSRGSYIKEACNFSIFINMRNYWRIL